MWLRRSKRSSSSRSCDSAAFSSTSCPTRSATWNGRKWSGRHWAKWWSTSPTTGMSSQSPSTQRWCTWLVEEPSLRLFFWTWYKKPICCVGALKKTDFKRLSKRLDLRFSLDRSGYTPLPRPPKKSFVKFSYILLIKSKHLKQMWLVHQLAINESFNLSSKIFPNICCFQLLQHCFLFRMAGCGGEFSFHVFVWQTVVGLSLSLLALDKRPFFMGGWIIFYLFDHLKLSCMPSFCFLLVKWNQKIQLETGFKNTVPQVTSCSSPAMGSSHSHLHSLFWWNTACSFLPCGQLLSGFFNKAPSVGSGHLHRPMISLAGSRNPQW